MPSSILVVLFGWLLALAIFFGFIVLLRYLQHRERMAMITIGIRPSSPRRQLHSRGMLRAGLITAMVGLALTIGLYPLGFILPPAVTTAPLHFGPWLLPGLIPLGVGSALIISYYLERDAGPPDDDPKITFPSDNEYIEGASQKSEE